LSISGVFSISAFYNINNIIDNGANLSRDPTNLIVGAKGLTIKGTLRRDNIFGEGGGEIIHASRGDIVVRWPAFPEQRIPFSEWATCLSS